jgi:FixJ family two-component response regulator
MAEFEVEIPMVFLAGRGNIPASVQTMKVVRVQSHTYRSSDSMP